MVITSVLTVERKLKSDHMQQITCEICGSNDIVKENDMYVCQSCGTKYSSQEAKRMYQDTVEVTGKVEVDQSSEIENLETLLNRSIKNKQWKDVALYSIDILKKDPHNWKATFFKELGEAYSGFYGNFKAYEDMIPATNTAIELLEEDGCTNLDEIKDFMAKHILNLTSALYDVAFEHHSDNLDALVRFWDSLVLIIKLQEFCIDLVYEDDVNEVYENIVYFASQLEVRRKFYIYDDYEYESPNYSTTEYAKRTKEEYTKKIQDTDQDYEPAEVKGEGCYIATAVYGSYDCQEVWTLRRFRDETLYRHVLGRIFIRAYYSISPHIVKYFGKTRTFNKIFKKPLDVLVNRLQESHVRSDYYVDDRYKED